MNKLEDFYKRRRILITGADGFIGSHLTERLVEYGAIVSILVHNKELKNLNKIKNNLRNIIVDDIADKGVIRLIVNEKPQIIFHLAVDGYVRNSIENPLMVNRINLEGTLNVLEASRALMNNGFERLIFSSSCLVYGTKLDPIKESDELKPNNPYAASKAAAELYCYSYFRTYNLPVAIIRPFNTYGPRQTKDVVPLFIEKAFRNYDITLEGGGLQTRDFNYIDDTIYAFLIMGSNEKAIGEAVNFGSGKDITIKDLAEKIRLYSSSMSKLINAPERPGQDIRLCCDNSKAKKLFNWESKVSIEEGLKKTIEWYKENVENA